MKKMAYILIAAILMVSLSAVGVSAQISNPTKLVVLGDSISTGFGLQGYPTSDKNYGNQLETAFNLTQASYANLAVDGVTSSELLATINSASPAMVAAVASADTIVLSIGGNDMLRPFMADVKVALGLPVSATTVEVQTALATNPNAINLIFTRLTANGTQYGAAASLFATNFTSIITGIRTVNSTAKIYIQTIYNPFSGVPGYENLSNFDEAVIGSMNNAITTGATAGNYTALDIHALFQTKALLLTNITQFDIHPNEAGHTAIFNAVYTAITGNIYVAPTTQAPTEPTTQAQTEPTTQAQTEPTTQAQTEPTTQAQTTAPTAPTNTPQTSDNTPITFYFAFAILAAGSMVLVSTKRKNNVVEK